jgi:hypothetical protein
MTYLLPTDPAVEPDRGRLRQLAAVAVVYG